MYEPNFFLIISLSLRLSPHEFTIITSEVFNFGAIFIASANDEEALNAYKLVSELENISPSLEPSHAFAESIKRATKLKTSDVIIVNSCVDSLKDKYIIKKKLGSYIR